MARVLMHVDLNCFFARCEVLKNPKLAHKPVAVGALGRRGVVSTCSYEARKYGIHSGMPTFKALELYPKLIVVPGDYRYYSLMSKEFFAFAHTYTAKVEAASIDECFIDITDVIKDREINQFLKEFQQKLLKKTGLMCSIGVGPTRFLAKMGSDYKKPMGITIMRKRDVKTKILPLPVENFYGIGMRTTPRLKRLGIKTIGDFLDYINNHEIEAREMFGKYLDDLKADLNGTSDDKIYTEISDPKSISSSMTLMMDTNDDEEISKALLINSKEVSDKAKVNQLKGKTIQLILRDSDFKNYLKSITVEKATNDANEIEQIAFSLFHKYYKNLEVRLVGVGLSNLVPLHESNVQLSFFEEAPVDKVNDVVNAINRKFKKKVVDKASIMLKEKKHGLK